MGSFCHCILELIARKSLQLTFFFLDLQTLLMIRMIPNISHGFSFDPKFATSVTDKVKWKTTLGESLGGLS